MKHFHFNKETKSIFFILYNTDKPMKAIETDKGQIKIKMSTPLEWWFNIPTYREYFIKSI
jgi:hypothetical protein